MATGGERNAAWRFTATIVPNRIGSIWKWVSSGMKIGQKMTMISVHSSGQPSRKMISCARIWKPSGERFIDSTQRSMSDWPPCSANTAEKSAEGADGARLRRGADAEEDHRQHDDGEHAERHHGGDQLLEDLQLLAVHAPEVGEQQQRGERRQSPEPRVEVLRDLPRPGVLARIAERGHLLRRALGFRGRGRLL